MKILFQDSSQSYPVELVPAGKSFQVIIDGKSYEAESLRIENGRLELILNGQRLTAYVSSDGIKRWVTVNGQTYLLTHAPETPSSRRKPGGPGKDRAGEVTAPMPGLVRAVNVIEGEAVSKSQTLMVLEAMKMEIRIQTPQDGVVEKLFVKQGQTVERGQILVTVKET